MKVEYCHCGRPLHYSDPEIEKRVRMMVVGLGEFIPVHCAGRTFKVQRHYIALHGIKGSELAMLGFEEIHDERE